VKPVPQDRKLTGELLYSLEGEERSLGVEADLPLAAWLSPATISGNACHLCPLVSVSRVCNLEGDDID
jgi:hypothetical protein